MSLVNGFYLLDVLDYDLHIDVTLMKSQNCVNKTYLWNYLFEDTNNNRIYIFIMKNIKVNLILNYL